jgi:aryl-alcohol dehydrogenase-like predicted oxidoreductase
MGVDQVDVVLSHAPDPNTPIPETLRAFVDLLEQGHARHWGVSNVDAESLGVWLDEADRAGAPKPLFVENEYSLLQRADEAAVLPMCRDHGIGYLAFSPLAGGVLSGKYRRGEQPPPGSRLTLRPDAAAALTPDSFDRLDALAARAASLGVSPAGLALAWVMAQDGVRPIAGARVPAHLDALQEALELRLSSEDAAALAREVSGP